MALDLMHLNSTLSTLEFCISTPEMLFLKINYALEILKLFVQAFIVYLMHVYGWIYIKQCIVNTVDVKFMNFNAF